MPDHIASPPTNVLPVWDSFEAVFFVVAGCVIGFALAYVLPSIWLTLKRRFRPHTRYIDADIPWNRSLDIDLNILHTEKKDSAKNTADKSFSLTQSFVIARDLVQRKELRHAVKIYGEILTSDKADASSMHRALFELAQVYFEVGLHTRSFEMILELLKRRPRDVSILEFLLRMLTIQNDEDKLVKAYRIFKGHINENLRKKMAYIACLYAEKRFKLNKNSKRGFELIRLAKKIKSDFPYASFLMWQFNSRATQKTHALNIKAKWVAFGAKLDAWINLCEDNGLSPYAGAEHIADLMCDILIHDPHFECFDGIQNEVKNIIHFKKNSTTRQKLILDSIFSSIILLREKQAQMIETNCLLFLKKICDNEQISKEVFNLAQSVSNKVLKLVVSNHQCRFCQSIFSHFEWSCKVCQEPESLKSCASFF